MEVRLGYKQTNVGLIPQDWDVKSLGDLGAVLLIGWRDFQREQMSQCIHRGQEMGSGNEKEMKQPISHSFD